MSYTKRLGWKFIMWSVNCIASSHGHATDAAKAFFRGRHACVCFYIKIWGNMKAHLLEQVAFRSSFVFDLYALLYACLFAVLGDLLSLYPLVCFASTVVTKSYFMKIHYLSTLQLFYFLPSSCHWMQIPKMCKEMTVQYHITTVHLLLYPEQYGCHEQ